MAIGRAGKIAVDIVGDSTGLKRAIYTAERDLDRLNRSGTKSMAALKTAGLAAGAAVGTGLAAVFSTGVREMIEFEKVAARTANVIETTGGAADISAKQVEDLANKIQELTGTEDDLVQAGANVLLTFDKVSARGGVFERTLALANDMSVAMGTDMESASRKLGKVLQDPTKGLGSLSRAIGALTDKQQAHIDKLVEQNRLGDAQGFVLGLLERKFKGAAQSEGDLTEKTQQLNRQYEEFSQTAVGKIVPALLAVFNALNRAEKATDRWREAVKRAITTADQSIKDTFNRIVAFLAAIPAKAITATLAIGRGIATGIGRAARSAFTAARNIGIAVVNGIVQGIRDAAGRIASAVANVIPDDLTPGFDFPGIATGGMIAGAFDAKDDVPIRVSRGEVILNPIQQRMVGMDRIRGALRRTGGVVVGGDSFAGGGYVTPFPGGSWSGSPAGHAARALGNWQSDNAWDIMGSGPVYAVLPGTIGRVSASDSRPQFAGQGVYLHTADGTWWYKHIKASVSSGQTVKAGDVIGSTAPITWVNGGPHLHLATDRGDPNRAQSGRAPGDLVRTAQGSPSGNQPGAEERPRLSPIQKVAKMLGALGIKVGGGIAARGVPGVRDVSAGLSGSGLTERESRAAGGAGRAASAAARNAGLSPEAAAAAGTEAERQAEIKFLNKHLGAARESLGTLASQKRNLLADYQRIGRQKAKTPAALAAKRKLMKANRAKRRAITAEMADVREVIEDIRASLAEIDAQAAAERYQIDYDLAQEKIAADAADAEAAKAAAEAGPTADQQAQIDQSNERARVATRGAALSDALSRTLFGSGTIDPGAGFVTVNIQTLHPGDPAIQGEVARWVVGALGGQGSVPTSAFSAGV